MKYTLITIMLMAGLLIFAGCSKQNSNSGVKSPVQALQSNADFDALLADNSVVLVDFYADWCGPCQTLKPVIHTIATEYEGRANVAAVNVDQLGELAGKFGVRSIPTVIVFKNGEPQDTFIGVKSKSAYTGALDKHLAAGSDS